MVDIFDAFQEFDNSLTQRVKEYSGILGLPTTIKTVNVPDRNGYVYVRLRDNESEIIQAYNEEVSPVWNLPVIIIRQGGGWRVKGRDVERYTDWGSSSSFMPEHHYQHEFNRAQPGGDIVFVYSDQFVPLLVTPSGTNGGPNVIVQQYTFKKSDGYFSVVGGTGTQSLLPYRPTNGQARMALVYLDRDSGNHGLLINTGTSFAGNLTGTPDVLPYLPTIPSSSYEPLYGVRLVSGTQTIQWDNLYDLRQFYGGSVSGSSGGGISEAPIDGKVYGRKDAGWAEVSGTSGGAGTPAGSDQAIQFNSAGSFGGEYDFHYDYNNNLLIIGSGTPPGYDVYGMHIMKNQGSPYLSLWAWQSNSSVSPYVVGYKARGTRAVPQAIEQFDDVFRIRARGHNGVNYTATQGQLLFNAPYDWVSGSHPVDASLWGTPSGSSTLTQFIEFTPAGANLPSGKTYNINGSPHTHDTREVLTSDRTYYVRTDGSDSNNGLTNSAGGAFLTIQKAIDTVGTLDISVYDVTIQLGDGTYTALGYINGPWVGQGTVTIQGNSGTPSNVVISVSNPGNGFGCITVVNKGSIIVKDLSVQTTTSGYGLLANNSGSITFQNVVFGACGTGHIRAQDGGYVTATGNYSITGNTTRHWFTTSGIIRIQNITVTLTGTPAFSSAFCDVTIVGVATVNAITFSGSATGTRYSATLNGVIFTNGGGATYLPGNAAGSTATGGQYA